MKPLIELTSYPTIPTPWNSEGPGEAWAWGDFFGILQHKPITLLETAQALDSKMPRARSNMRYDCAMFVYYRIDRNPHGPSKRPIIVIGVERANLHASAKKLGIDPSLLGMGPNGDGFGAPMLGIFTGEGRRNLGELPVHIDANSARAAFVHVWKDELGLTGEPERIGTMRDAFGHPKTGLQPATPAKPKGILSRLFG